MVYFGPSLALVVGFSAANTWAKSCQFYDIPITVTSTNLVYGIPPFQDNFDIGGLVDTFTSRTPPTASPFSGTTNVTANYTIAATFCSPGHGEANTHQSTVLIATHGLGFDGS